MPIMLCKLYSIIIVAVIFALLCTVAFAEMYMPNNTVNLPEGFVYLNRVDPTIMQHVMYYGEKNFVGQQIKGYNAPTVILTKEAAFALKNIQQSIKADNYSLLVYDAYRPIKAVQHFINWGQNVTDLKMKPFFYPYINKSEIFELGYVARRSAHSRGSTVDLTIIQLTKQLNTDPSLIQRTAKDGRLIPYWDDNSVDMFSSVDLLDSMSNHDSKLIDEPYLKNRNYLRMKMVQHGFVEYKNEWWHYTLRDEPFKNKYFDFDIQ